MKELHTGLAAMIGRPNVGKSTLMNQLIGQKVAITSNKPQTTRNRIRCVYTDPERGQIVFVDTPGIHKAKNRLGEYMSKVTESSVRDVDVILWLVEPDEHIGAGDRRIAEHLAGSRTPVILVINKIDQISTDEVFGVIDMFRELMDFSEIVPVCARSGKNCQELLDVLFTYLPKGPMLYPEDTLTDQPVRQIVAEIIREKALHALSDEVPHGIAVSVEQMKTHKKKGALICQIEATIICERASHKGIIIGKNGAMLKKIGTNARYEIERLLGEHVNLSLWVKVKKDWRDSDFMISNFGYRKEDE